MKFEVTEQRSKGIQEVSLEYKGETLKFKTTSYKTASITAREELFDHTNLFLAKLPEASRKALWDLYKEAHEILKLSSTTTALLSDLTEIERKIYEIVKYEDVRKYVYTGDIRFPAHLKTEYTDNDLRTRNYQIRTYLKPEYIDLVVLVLGLRFMLPIWGDVLDSIKKHHGNLVKEQIVIKALVKKKVEITNWPPYQRLQQFVEHTVDENKIGLAVVFGCLPASEVPMHLLSLALVRKLAPATLDPRQDSDNLIKIVFNYITHTNDRMDNRFGGRVSERKVARENAEEDNSSVWDTLQVNQEIPHGDQETIEVFTENVEQMARCLYDEIDMDKVNKCLKRLKKAGDIGESYHQIPMVMWVMGKIIPPDGIEGLLHDAIYRCMAVTQAYLWQHGFIELAILMTASRNEDDDEEFTAVDPGKYDKALVERLNALYPYWRQDTGRIQQGKRTNVAIAAINDVTKSISQCEWVSNAPDELNAEFDALASDKTWLISGNSRNQFASLVLHLFEN